MKTGIIAALPRELKGLVAGWDRIDTGRADVLLYERGELLAACGGIGGERAALAVEAVLARADAVGELLSFGLAGACDPGLRAGDTVWCGSVVEVRSGERFAAEGEGAVLVTATTIVGKAEKLRLRASYGAAVVDMEAASVARLARAHGLRFRALKAVSDTVEEAMEGMNEFVTSSGQFREGAFALHVTMRPGRWRAAMELGRASAAGLRAATDELLRAMEVAQGGSRD